MYNYQGKNSRLYPVTQSCDGTFGVFYRSSANEELLELIHQGNNTPYGRPPGFGNFPGQNAPPGMAGSPGMGRPNTYHICIYVH